jgi:hypothetical protein
VILFIILESSSFAFRSGVPASSAFETNFLASLREEIRRVMDSTSSAEFLERYLQR